MDKVLCEIKRKQTIHSRMVIDFVMNIKSIHAIIIIFKR